MAQYIAVLSTARRMIIGLVASTVKVCVSDVAELPWEP